MRAIFHYIIYNVKYFVKYFAHMRQMLHIFSDDFSMWTQNVSANFAGRCSNVLEKLFSEKSFIVNRLFICYTNSQYLP